MPTIHFLGRVIPKGIDLTFGGLPQAKYDSPENDLHVQLKFHITASDVDIECEVNRFTLADLENIHKIAFDLSRALVNLYDFATGVGLGIIFEAFIDPSGARSILCPMDKRLAPLCTALVLKAGEPSKSFNEVLEIVLREPPVVYGAKRIDRSDNPIACWPCKLCPGRRTAQTPDCTRRIAQAELGLSSTKSANKSELFRVCDSAFDGSKTRKP
jgi:hypothetical protein